MGPKFQLLSFVPSIVTHSKTPIVGVQNNTVAITRRQEGVRWVPGLNSFTLIDFMTLGHGEFKK